MTGRDVNGSEVSHVTGSDVISPAHFSDYSSNTKCPIVCLSILGF